MFLDFCNYVKYVETRTPSGEYIYVVSPKDISLVDTIYECIEGNEVYRLVSEKKAISEINDLLNEGYDIEQFKCQSCRLVLEGDPTLYICVTYLNGEWIFTDENDVILFKVDDETLSKMHVTDEGIALMQILVLLNYKGSVH